MRATLPIASFRTSCGTDTSSPILRGRRLGPDTVRHQTLFEPLFSTSSHHLPPCGLFSQLCCAFRTSHRLSSHRLLSHQLSSHSSIPPPLGHHCSDGAPCTDISPVLTTLTTPLSRMPVLHRIRYLPSSVLICIVISARLQLYHRRSEGAYPICISLYHVLVLSLLLVF